MPSSYLMSDEERERITGLLATTLRESGYSWNRISRLAEAIRTDLDALSCVGRPLDSVSGEILSRTFSRHLRAEEYVAVIRRVFEALYGRFLDQSLLAKLAWLVASNQRAFKAGNPVYLWTRQVRDEWCPVRIERMDYRAAPESGRNKSRRWFASFLIWGGSSATFRTTKALSPELCRVLSRRLGFGSGKNKIPFRSPRQFSGLDLYGYFAVKDCIRWPTCTELSVPSALLRSNQELLKARTRSLPTGEPKQPFVCPRGMSSSVACHLCPFGRDVCPVAVWPRSLETRLCRKCEKDQISEPGATSCVACQEETSHPPPVKGY